MLTNHESVSTDHFRFPLLSRDLGDANLLGYHPKTNRLLTLITSLLLLVTMIVHAGLHVIWSYEFPLNTEIVAFPPFYWVLGLTLLLLHYQKTWLAAQTLIFGIAIAQIVLMFVGIGLRPFVLISLLNTVLLTGIVLGSKPAMAATLVVLISVISFGIWDHITPQAERMQLIEIIPGFMLIPDLATMGFTGVILYLTISQIQHLYQTLTTQKQNEEKALADLQAVQSQNARKAVFGDALSAVSRVVMTAAELEDVTPYLTDNIRKSMSYRMLSVFKIVGDEIQLAQWDCAEYPNIRTIADLNALTAKNTANSWKMTLARNTEETGKEAMSEETYLASFLPALNFPRGHIYSFQMGRGYERGVMIIVMDDESPMNDENYSFLLTLTSILKARISNWDWNKSLAHTQKLEAVGILGGRVAHDFNNLLTSISGNTELLLQSSARNSPVQVQLEAIGDATNKAASLTRKLLSFTRKSERTDQEFDINQVIREFAPLLLSTLPTDIQLQLVLAPAPVIITADPQDFRNTISNLILNARDAIQGSGVIEVRTRLISGETSEKEWKAQLTIRDNGIGMNEEVQSHAFLPFFTTKNESTSAGLGLPFVYGTIKRSGGRISLNSTVDTGTTITLELPSFSPQTHGKDTPETDDQTTVPKGVITVEPDPDVEAALRQLLEELGFPWRGTRTISQARDLISSDENIKVLLIDTDPDPKSMDGINEWLASNRPDVRVIAISSWAHPSNTAERTVLRKPISLEALANALRNTDHNTVTTTTTHFAGNSHPQVREEESGE